MGALIPLSRWLLDDTPRAVARRGAEVIERAHFCARVTAWMETLRDRPGERFALYHGDAAEFLAIATGAASSVVFQADIDLSFAPQR